MFFSLFNVTRLRRKRCSLLNLWLCSLLFGFFGLLSRLKPTITFSSLKVQKKKKKGTDRCLWLWFAFKYQNSHYIKFAFFLCVFTFLPCTLFFLFHIYRRNFWKLKHTSKVMTNVASSGVNYWEIFFFSFFSPLLRAHFSVFFISPPVRFPLCGVPFIEIAMEVVCVWPARAVIEPICRLAPVGLNPGLTALRWLNAFAVFLKPILFLFLPPLPSLWQPPPTFLLVRMNSLLKLMLKVSIGLVTLRSVSCISCVTQHDTADLCRWKRKKKKAALWRKLVKCRGHALCCPSLIGVWASMHGFAPLNLSP